MPSVIAKRSLRQRMSILLSFFLLFVTLGGSLSGCTFWKNFSTYFNILYLAQAHLDAYEDQQKEPPPPMTGGQAVMNHRWLDEEYESRESALRSGKQQKITVSFIKPKQLYARPVTNTHLDSAIILGSKILADRKETKYVEDALFIVGKAQLYKNDVAGAKRKFNELLFKYPQTKYRAETEALLARTMLSKDELDSANATLNAAQELAELNKERTALAMIHRSRAEIIFKQHPDSLAGVINELQEAENNLSGDEAAKLAIELGNVEYLEGRWSDAEQAFRRASERAADPYTQGEAHIAHAMSLRRLGQFEPARQELNTILSKAKYTSNQPVARFELAYTEEVEARQAVQNDLHNPEFRSTYFPKVREAYYTLDTTYKNESAAILVRSKFRQAELFRAVGAYDSAAQFAMHLINTKDFATDDMNDYVSDRMRSLQRFAQWRNEFRQMDSTDRELQRARSGGQLSASDDQAVYTEASQQVLGDRWKPNRQVDLTPEEKAKIDQVAAKLSAERKTKSSLKKLGVNDTVRFTDSLYYRMGNAQYEIGRAYENFLEFDSARYAYKKALDYHFVVVDTSKEAFRAQVLYTWLQLEAHAGNTLRKDSLLKELTTYYNQTIYAQQAVLYFGGPQSKSSPGEMAYLTAYQQLKSNGLDNAKPALLNVIDNYRRDDVAARALYAIGLSYEDISRFDSAVRYYREILHSYPYSAYADAIRPRLADASPVPVRTARRVDLKSIQTDEDKQKESAEKARQERERLMREQMEQMKQQDPGGQQQTNAPTIQDASDQNPVPPPPPPGGITPAGQPKPQAQPQGQGQPQGQTPGQPQGQPQPAPATDPNGKQPHQTARRVN